MMEEGEDPLSSKGWYWVYDKPKGVVDGRSPSKHLCLLGAGARQGVREDAVVKALGAFGRVVRVEIPEGMQYSFASFEEVSSATAAKEALDGLFCEELCGKKPIVRYTTLSRCPRKERVSHGGKRAALTVPSEVKGLILLPNFVDANEEEQIIRRVDELGPWDSMISRGVMHFGYIFSYSTLRADEPAPPIPDFLLPLVESITKALGPNLLVRAPDQLTVNNYQPGDGISPHVDTHSAFEPAILSLSLGSGCAMDFRSGKLHRPLYLPRRSLLVMSGDARYGWTHGIAARKSDLIEGEDGEQLRTRRLSLTWRIVRQFQHDCSCRFPSVCDAALNKRWNQARRQRNMNPIELPPRLVFSAEESNQVEDVLVLNRPLHPLAQILDLSCSFVPQGRTTWTVFSSSSSGLNSSGNNPAEMQVVIDVTLLPFRDGCFDACLIVGVFPEAGSSDRRILAMYEVGRVLKENGLAYFLLKSEGDKAEVRRLQTSVQGFGGSQCIERGAVMVLTRSRHSVRISCIQDDS